MSDTEKLSGGCHCGAIRYRMSPNLMHHALCHCSDCRRHSGAPMVGWALIQASDLEVDGSPKIYASSADGRRHFCGNCGTSLFYSNEAIFPGLIDVQSATLDDGNAITPPGAQIQLAERLHYMDDLASMPRFDRYPSPE